MRPLLMVFVIASLVLTACDRSDRSRTAGAVPDDSEYGVVTAPTIGSRMDQPNITGQPNVTTATTASAPENTLGTGQGQTQGGAGSTTATNQATNQATTNTAQPQAAAPGAGTSSSNGGTTAPR